MNDSQRTLTIFQLNQNAIFLMFITMDDTLINHYTCESNNSLSPRWNIAKAAQRDQKRENQLENLGQYFQECIGHNINRLPRERKNSHTRVLCIIIGSFEKKNQQNRHHMAKKKVMFHQLNAPTHTSMKAIAKLVEMLCEFFYYTPHL